MRIASVTIGGRADSATNGFATEDLSITRAMAERGGSAALNLHPKDGPQPFRPTTLMEITIERASPSARVFGGWVTAVEEVRQGGEPLWYRLTCADWSKRLEHATTGAMPPYVAQSDRAILQSVFTALSTPLGGIDAQDGFVSITQLVIEHYDASAKSALTILRELAELTGASWYIDAHKHLRWFEPVYRVASIALGDAQRLNWPLNLVRRSEALDDAEWTKTGVTITPGVPQRPPIVPIGAADRIYEAAGTGLHGISQTISTAERDHTLSAYVLGASNVGGRTACALVIEDANGATHAARFDLAAELAESTTGATAGIEDASDVIAGANPWRRVWLSADLPSGTHTCRLLCRDAYAGTPAANSYAGDSTKGLVATALQLRPGSTLGHYRASTDGTERSKPYACRAWSNEHDDPANSVTVRGAADSDGNEITVTETDPASIALYGTWERVIRDTQITDTDTARLRARVELVRDAHPRVRATLVVEYDGIDVGDSVLIGCPARGLDFEPLVVESLRQQQSGLEWTTYTLDFGPPVRDEQRLLQLLAWRNRNPTDLPPGVLADSLPGFAIDDRSIEGVKLVLQTIDGTVIADDAIKTPHVLSGQITGIKLAAEVLLADNIRAGTLAASIRITSPDIIAMAAGMARKFVRLNAGTLQFGAEGEMAAEIDTSARLNLDYLVMGLYRAGETLTAPDWTADTATLPTLTDTHGSLALYAAAQLASTASNLPAAIGCVIHRQHARAYLLASSDGRSWSGSSTGLASATFHPLTGTPASGQATVLMGGAIYLIANQQRNLHDNREARFRISTASITNVTLSAFVRWTPWSVIRLNWYEYISSIRYGGWRDSLVVGAPRMLVLTSSDWGTTAPTVRWISHATTNRLWSEIKIGSEWRLLSLQLSDGQIALSTAGTTAATLAAANYAADLRGRCTVPPNKTPSAIIGFESSVILAMSDGSLYAYSLGTGTTAIAGTLLGTLTRQSGENIQSLFLFADELFIDTNQRFICVAVTGSGITWAASTPDTRSADDLWASTDVQESLVVQADAAATYPSGFDGTERAILMHSADRSQRLWLHDGTAGRSYYRGSEGAHGGVPLRIVPIARAMGIPKTPGDYKVRVAQDEKASWVAA